ncbi:MAG TPA: hypothetical protein VGE52_00870 [Pirellulales bacterium]
MSPANPHNINGATRPAARARDLLGPSRSRSPEEALGAVAEGSLGSSMVWATAATFALLIAGTVVPWAIAHTFPAETKPKQTVAEASSDAAKPTSEASGESQATGEATAAPVGTGAAPGAVELLGIGEEKKAPPTKNPLEEGLDDLLKVD